MPKTTDFVTLSASDMGVSAMMLDLECDCYECRSRVADVVCAS